MLPKVQLEIDRSWQKLEERRRGFFFNFVVVISAFK